MKGKKYIIVCMLVAALVLTLPFQGFAKSYDAIYWNSVASNTDFYIWDGRLVSRPMTLRSRVLSIGGVDYPAIELEANAQVVTDGYGVVSRVDSVGGNFQYNLKYEMPLNIPVSDAGITFTFLFSLLNSNDFNSISFYADGDIDIAMEPMPVSVSGAFQVTDLGGARYAVSLTFDTSDFPKSDFMQSMSFGTLNLYIKCPSVNYNTPILVFLTDTTLSPDGSAEVVGAIEGLGDQIEDIFNPRPGDDEDMGAIESGMSDVGDKLESMGDVLAGVETVDPDDIPMGFEEVVGTNFNFANVSDFFGVIMGPTFLTMSSIVVTLVLVSYVLFGKKA